MSLKYETTYKESIENPEKFWAQAATKVHWYHQWDKVLDVVDNHYRWFVGGCMNSCYNALDLHIDNGRGDQLAIIYDSPVTDTKRTYTYRELRQRVSKTASILVNSGVCFGVHFHAELYLAFLTLKFSVKLSNFLANWFQLL